MGVFVEDLRGGDNKLSCQWWQWRPTVQLLKSFNLIEHERLDLLLQGVGELAEEEAHQIAAIFERNVLPKLTAGNQPPVDPANAAYIPARQWLKTFTEFCRHSAGIRVFY
jgi:hypothetical protein